jgi:DNA modification methylase
MKSAFTSNFREIIGREPPHPFPARMAPGIALDALGKNEKRLRVLDPMMGSGTVMAVAAHKGHKSIGFDLDPLAVLIARVWTTPIDTKRFEQLAEKITASAKERARTLRDRDAYPKNADAETKAFMRYWFDPLARKQLTALSEAIKDVRNRRLREALWCAFSRLIITKSAGASRAMDLSHSRPHRVFERAPVKPLSKFAIAARYVAQSIKPASKSNEPIHLLKKGDARRIPLRASSVDLVITSPPYLNAIDYIRCSKFTLVWMGHSIPKLSKLRRESVGTEVGLKCGPNQKYIKQIAKKMSLNKKLSIRHEAILARFIEDMCTAIREVARVLVPGGKAIYVVGENTVRGSYIRNSSLIIEAAKLSGMRLRKKQSRRLPQNKRYLPPPSAKKERALLNARMRREVVLTLQKPKVAA